MKTPRHEISSNLYGELVVYGGTANQPLTESVCHCLGICQAESTVTTFPNSNTFVQLAHSARSKDVFLIQPTSAPANDNLMELLIFIETLRRDSAGRITAVIPYYGYGRSDKKDVPRSPITARLVADLIITAGADRILTIDSHAGQIQGFFNIPVDEVSAIDIIAGHIRALDIDLNQTTVVSPDVGSVKRARNLAEKLHVPMAIIEKRRSHQTGLAMFSVIGEVKNRDLILFDDEIDTGSTICKAAEFLKEHGGRRLFAAATHPVLSGGAVELLVNSAFTEVIVTDSIPVPQGNRTDSFHILPMGRTLAGVIDRIHRGESVGEYLNY